MTTTAPLGPERLRWLLLLGGLLSCAPGAKDVPPDPLVFVRGGVMGPAGAGGQPLSAGRSLWTRAWSPGDRVTIAGASGIAPRRAECVPLFQVDLGDVSRLVAMGGAAPNTSLAWSPDGSRLAVGSYRGEVLVLDGWSGAVLQRRRLAESMVKHVAWSPDGRSLYASEQSPDAYLHALDPGDLRSRWRVRLADEVGSSPAPDGEDLYGVYTLPAAYDFVVLSDGDLLVAASHGWNGADGLRLNRARLLRLGPDGTQEAAWPERPLDGTLSRFRVDEAGGMLVVSVGRSASGPPPDSPPIGGAQVLRLSDLSPVRFFSVAPLAPYFRSVFLWEALDLDAGRGVVAGGYGDGRVLLWPLDGSTPTELDIGTPVLSGDVPIAASIGFGLLHEDSFLFHSSGTNIPYASQVSAAQPPSAHPKENAIYSYGLDGALRWTWRGTQRLGGLQITPDGDHAVFTTTAQGAQGAEDGFGALVFDLRGEGSGEQRLEAICSTEGPTFFRPAARDDGRIAVSESPFLGTDGQLLGAYRVTVLR